jgi:hypothetical protein
MHSAVNDMLKKNNFKTADDFREALREIIQEIALLGLYRSNFFDRACFFGGTALRIFYDLDRFSEDLDFSLNKPDPDFNLDPYLKYVHSELSAFGFVVEVQKKLLQLIVEQMPLAGSYLALLSQPASWPFDNFFWNA